MFGRTFARGAAGISVLAVAWLMPSLASAAGPPRYYLALGDSLSQGVQPNARGVSVETKQGYANDLFAFERRHIGTLKLVDLGCPGDTTGSMLTGRGNSKDAQLAHCDRKGGSQLKAAQMFLKAHHTRGEVPLITVDIGANDLDGCANVPTSQIGSCVSSGEASISHDVPLILKGLKKAAPKGTKFAAMTLYDPVLSYFFSSDSTQRSLVTASVSLIREVNTDLMRADKASGFKTADVAGAFKTYDTSDMVPFKGQSVPVDVANVCSWTWACTPPPRGPNIHANQTGYKMIAGAFEKVVGRLH